MLARGTPARAGRVGVDACAVAELLAVRAHATARLPVARGYAIRGRFARGARGAAGLGIVVGDAAAGAGMLAWGTLRHGDLGTRVARGIVWPVGRGILPPRAAGATIHHHQAAARRGARAAQDAHRQRHENPSRTYPQSDHQNSRSGVLSRARLFCYGCEVRPPARGSPGGGRLSILREEGPHFFGHPSRALPRVSGRRRMAAIERTPADRMTRRAAGVHRADVAAAWRIR